jgi:hypothetical protein
MNKISLFLAFLMLGCSQHNSSCKRTVPPDRKVVVANRDEKPNANRDSIKFVDLPLNTTVVLSGNLKIKQVLGPFKTNIRADSICWQFLTASPGISMEPMKGKGNHSKVTFTLQRPDATGELVLQAIPYKSRYSSKPSTLKFTFQRNSTILPEKTERITGKNPHLSDATGCSADTMVVNRQRRKKIVEFRDLLYMYAKTTSDREKEYFKIDAENKLNEIPGLLVDIVPGNDIHDVFTDPPWSDPVVVPVYDNHRCYIIGIKVRKK